MTKLALLERALSHGQARNQATCIRILLLLASWLLPCSAPQPTSFLASHTAMNLATLQRTPHTTSHTRQHAHPQLQAVLPLPKPFHPVTSCLQGRRMLSVVRASTSDNPVRQALSGLASGIYKATASFQTVDSSLPPLWQALQKLDIGAVQTALRNGANPNEANAQGDTPLLYIAREGHYKYPPQEIPALLIQSGANLEAQDSTGRTALQVALLSGWQNIAELLIKNGAQTGGVADVKASITCPDCKRIVATYNL